MCPCMMGHNNPMCDVHKNTCVHCTQQSTVTSRTPRDRSVRQRFSYFTRDHTKARDRLGESRPAAPEPRRPWPPCPGTAVGSHGASLLVCPPPAFVFVHLDVWLPLTVRVALCSAAWGSALGFSQENHAFGPHSFPCAAAASWPRTWRPAVCVLAQGPRAGTTDLEHSELCGWCHPTECGTERGARGKRPGQSLGQLWKDKGLWGDRDAEGAPCMGIWRASLSPASWKGTARPEGAEQAEPGRSSGAGTGSPRSLSFVCQRLAPQFQTHPWGALLLPLGSEVHADGSLRGPLARGRASSTWRGRKWVHDVGGSGCLSASELLVGWGGLGEQHLGAGDA